MTESDRIPVTVLTGFLGSGKTTLLRRLLRDPAAADTAVIINEFGEIGLDHAMVEAVDGETVVMASGCVCCSIRSDLADTMIALIARVEAGQLPGFKRLLIETTGLADPAPIVHMMLADERVSHRFRLHQLITTIDAVNGATQIEVHGESRKQAAMADTLLLTKTDIASESASVVDRLRSLNPHARLRAATAGEVDFAWLLDSRWFDPGQKPESVREWLGAEAAAGHHHHHHHDVNRHDDRIAAFNLIIEEPLDWLSFSMWLSYVLMEHGAKLLRLKGLLNLSDHQGPVAIHGVHHLLHDPVPLDTWPDDSRASRLVFIATDLEAETIQQSWREFAAAG